MSAILFAPHNDDETLFAFYSMLRHKPTVIVVLRSFTQNVMQGGPLFRVREAETKCATELAGCPLIQWEFPDMSTRWDAVAETMEDHVREVKPDLVIAPAWEIGGHDDHNAVGNIAAAISKDRGFLRYYTYRRGYGRSMEGREVEATDEERALKQQALACYESQRAHPPTAPWFDPAQYGDLREWAL